jgi:hypothetical protein
LRSVQIFKLRHYRAVRLICILLKFKVLGAADLKQPEIAQFAA